MSFARVKMKHVCGHCTHMLEYVLCEKLQESEAAGDVLKANPWRVGRRGSAVCLSTGRWQGDCVHVHCPTLLQAPTGGPAVSPWPLLLSQPVNRLSPLLLDCGRAVQGHTSGISGQLNIQTNQQKPGFPRLLPGGVGVKPRNLLFF